MQLTDFKVEVISGVEVRKIQVNCGESIRNKACPKTQKQHYHDDQYCFEANKFKLCKFNG